MLDAILERTPTSPTVAFEEGNLWFDGRNFVLDRVENLGA